jgi:hypothetical protein
MSPIVSPSQEISGADASTVLVRDVVGREIDLQLAW